MPGDGLRQSMRLPVGLDRGLRMERAVAPVVDRAAGPTGLVADPVQCGADRCLVVEAARDAGLVGHDEDVPEIPGGISNGVERAVHPFEPVPRADIAVVDVQHAVTIEEQCLAAAAARGFPSAPRRSRPARRCRGNSRLPACRASAPAVARRGSTSASSEPIGARLSISAVSEQVDAAVDDPAAAGRRTFVKRGDPVCVERHDAVARSIVHPAQHARGRSPRADQPPHPPADRPDCS